MWPNDENRLVLVRGCVAECRQCVSHIVEGLARGKDFQVDKNSMLSSLQVHVPLVADGLGQLSNLLERAQLLCIRDWHGDLAQTVVTGL